VHRHETYVAGFSHQIGRYSDAIRVPAGQGHDQIIVSGTIGFDENGAIAGRRPGLSNDSGGDDHPQAPRIVTGRLTLECLSADRD
jgi:hypothetical protein